MQAESTIRGGHGEVTRVRTGGRLEAVKSSFANDEESARRIRFEAAQLRAIDHFGFPKAHALRETPNGPSLHMDWIDGMTVDALILQRPPLSVDACLLVAADVCDALAAANQQIGLVHRDIKPLNLMVDNQGRTVVVDLGCARSDVGDPDRAGEIVGTLAYMAPERLEGRPHGAAVDVYGLGIVLIELLCGSRAGGQRWGNDPDSPRIGSIRSDRHHLGVLHALRAADALRRTDATKKVWNIVFSMAAWLPRERPCLEEAARELRGLVENPLASRHELAQRVQRWSEAAPKEALRDVPGLAHRMIQSGGAVLVMAACAMLVALGSLVGAGGVVGAAALG